MNHSKQSYSVTDRPQQLKNNLVEAKNLNDSGRSLGYQSSKKKQQNNRLDTDEEQNIYKDSIKGPETHLNLMKNIISQYENAGITSQLNKKNSDEKIKL